MNNDLNTKKQNRKVTIFAFFLSFLAIGILVFGFTLVSSDKVVLIQSISNVYNKIVTLDDDSMSLMDKFSSSKSIKIKSIVNYKAGDNTYILNGNYEEIKSDKKSKVDLNITDGIDTLIDGNVVFNDNNAYMFMNNITDTYLSTKFDYIGILNSLNSNDYDKVVTLLKEAIDSTISNKDIDKEKTTITYKGKDKKVSRLTYKVDNKKLEKIFDKFISSIKKDKTLFSHISSVMNMKTSELSKLLDDFSNSLKSLENKTYLTYRTYYYGFNKIIKYELEVSDIGLLIEYENEDDDNTLVIKIADQEVFNLVYTKNKNNYKFSGRLVNLINKELSDSVITFDGESNNDKLSLNVKGNNSYAIFFDKINSNENSYKYSGKVTVKEIDSDVIKAEMDGTIEILFDSKLDITIDESRNISDLSEEELNEINTNLEEIPYVRMIIDKIVEFNKNN